MKNVEREIKRLGLTSKISKKAIIYFLLLATSTGLMVVAVFAVMYSGVSLDIIEKLRLTKYMMIIDVVIVGVSLFIAKSLFPRREGVFMKKFYLSDAVILVSLSIRDNGLAMILDREIEFYSFINNAGKIVHLRDFSFLDDARRITHSGQEIVLYEDSVEAIQEIEDFIRTIRRLPLATKN